MDPLAVLVVTLFGGGFVLNIGAVLWDEYKTRK